MQSNLSVTALEYDRLSTEVATYCVMFFLSAKEFKRCGFFNFLLLSVLHLDVHEKGNLHNNNKNTEMETESCDPTCVIPQGRPLVMDTPKNVSAGVYFVNERMC